MKDLSQLSTQKQAPKGVRMKIEDPSTGKPLTYEVGEGDKKEVVYPTLILLGPDSDQYRKTMRDAQDRKLERQARRGRKLVKITAKELEEDSLDVLVACTVGWEHIWLNNAELPFNAQNVRLLYQSVGCIREQVDEFINDRAHFLGNS